MKVKLKKPIVGYLHNSELNCIDWSQVRQHAEVGDVLTVIFQNTTHFICDSLKFPGLHIVIFRNQCEEIIPEITEEDIHAEEKYYNVYENNSNSNLDDSFYTDLVDDEQV